MVEVLSLLVLTGPLAVWGCWSIGNWLKEKILVRRGYFKAYFRQKNHRKIMRVVKPEGDYIRIRKNAYPFNDGLGYIYYEGNTPTIEYNEHGQQLNFITKEKETVDAINVDALMTRTYNLGKSHGSKDIQMIKIASFVAAGASVLCTLLVMGLLQNMA
jgi:hypothetical protein